MRPTLLLALFVASCQPGPEGPAGPAGPSGTMGAPGKDGTSTPAAGATTKAGSRIKVQWSTTTVTTSTEDGASVENTSQGAPQFFDTKLDTICAIGTAEDGALRCLPTTAVTLTPRRDDEQLEREERQRPELLALPRRAEPARRAVGNGVAGGKEHRLQAPRVLAVLAGLAGLGVAGSKPSHGPSRARPSWSQS